MSTQLQEAKPLFAATVGSASSALVQIESSRAVQEVQAALVIAKKFPRDQQGAFNRVITACQRPSLANVAIYQYARGGSDISGPSIRLAEAIALEWGNIATGWRIINQTEQGSTVEAFAWDQETNTRRSMTFEVPHERHTRQGVKKLTDPRDIYELCANQAARRLRACILATIPGDVVEAALEQCEATMNAKADTSPAALAKLVEAFSAYGIERAQIEKRIQRNLDSITAAQVVALRKVYQSLKDGMSSPADWFEAVVPSANVATKKASIKDSPLVLDGGAPTLREQVQGRIKAAALEWSQVATAAEMGGLFVDRSSQLSDVPEDALRDILAAWDNLAPMAKEVKL